MRRTLVSSGLRDAEGNWVESAPVEKMVASKVQRLKHKGM